MKCTQCNKTIKENTDGDNKYCQGHDIIEAEETKTKAELMAEENDLSVEINQAYIDNVGEEYAEADACAEAYSGTFADDEEFAQDMAEQVGAIDKDAKWPQTCIDWEQASRELMYDYFEENGHYFRNS